MKIDHLFCMYNLLIRFQQVIAQLRAILSREFSHLTELLCRHLYNVPPPHCKPTGKRGQLNRDYLEATDYRAARLRRRRSALGVSDFYDIKALNSLTS